MPEVITHQEPWPEWSVMVVGAVSPHTKVGRSEGTWGLVCTPVLLYSAGVGCSCLLWLPGTGLAMQSWLNYCE